MLKLKQGDWKVGTIDWEDPDNIETVLREAESVTSIRDLANILDVKETMLRTNIYRHFPGLSVKIKSNRASLQHN